MSFAEPRLLLLLLAVPAALGAAWALLAKRRRAESAWAARAMLARLRADGRPRPAWLAAALIALVVAGLALALARPRWGTSVRTVERRGVDVVVVLDTSLSMAAQDVAPSRFWLASSLVRRIVRSLPQERFALVAAEGVGLVLTPLTVDGAVLDLLLDSTEPASLPVPGTRLGPALERALALFPEGSETHRVLLLVGDGEFHDDDLDTAIAALGEAGVVVHAIGVGTEHGAPVPLPGETAGVKRDRDGNVVISRLERSGLERMAERTGGLYLEATDARADPAPIVRRIAGMQGSVHEATELETREERFQWPLAAAAAALAAWLVAGAHPLRRRRVA